MNLKRYLHRVWRWTRNNLALAIVAVVILVVSSIALMKLFTTETEHIYVKVRVSQGLWWAATQRPGKWYAQAIKIGDRELSMTGKPIAEIVDVRLYPFWSSDQYDVYITLKLEVEKDTENGSYIYKNDPVLIAAPIEFDFPSAYVSSTVMALSSEPFEYEYIDKTVTLNKKFAPSWEYDAIIIGDTYSDGHDTVVEILDKTSRPSTFLTADSTYRVTNVVENGRDIQVVMRMKVRETDGEYMFGEEQVIKPGKTINVSTETFYFDQYIIESIQ